MVINGVQRRLRAQVIERGAMEDGSDLYAVQNEEEGQFGDYATDHGTGWTTSPDFHGWTGTKAAAEAYILGYNTARAEFLNFLGAPPVGEAES